MDEKGTKARLMESNAPKVIHVCTIFPNANSSSFRDGPAGVLVVGFGAFFDDEPFSDRIERLPCSRERRSHLTNESAPSAKY